MKKSFNLFVLISFLILISGSMNAQGKFGKIGKVFSNPEAKVLFGKVYGSVTISVDELREAVSNAGDYIYITIKSSQPIFTNEKRETLIRKMRIPKLSPDEKMIVFSKSAVEDFLNSIGSGTTGNAKVNSTAASSGTVSVERRASVTTLSANGYTLEFATVCPPMCI
jgi:hypothetical protein